MVNPMVAVKRPNRLFTKNTVLCEGASRCIEYDACPVLEGQTARISMPR